MAKTIHEEEYRLIDKVSAGFSTIASGLKGLSNRFTELNQASELAGKGIGFVVDAAKGIGEAVSGAADYEEAMRRVSNRTNATAEEQVQLQQAVRAAADAVGATAEESAAALRNMADDGYSARDAIDSLGAVLAYAKVQAVGAAEAAGGLGGILDSFGPRVISVGQVADALTATAQAAGTTTDTLEKGLGGLGLAAQQANISFEQSVALLGTLALRNIEGSDASKRLATILEEFSDSSSKAGKALADLGLSGADFTTVLQRLNTDSAAATKVLESLGLKPRAALTALLADGGGALQEMTRIIDANQGATQRAADALKGTFNDALKNVMAQISILQVVAGGPVLTPLADSLQVLSDRLSEFANSPEFALLTEQLGRLATEAANSVADFITTLNFEAAANNIAEFAAAFSDNFSKVAEVATVVGGVIGTMYDVVKGGSAVLAEAFTGVASDIAGVVGLVSDDAAEISRVFADMSRNARGLSDDALADLSKRFGLTSQQATALATATRDAALSAKVAAGDFKSLGDALPKSSIDATIERLSKFGLLLKKDLPEASAAGAEGIKTVGDEAAVTATNIERIKIGNLLRQMDDLFRSGQAGSDAYKALNTQFLAAEARLNELTGAADKAKQAQDDLANNTDRAAQSLRNQANAARDAAGGADELSRSNSQVSESFGNIGAEASSVAISLGNLSEAFARQALDAAAASGSLDGYLQTLNLAFARGQEIDQQVQARIDQLNRQNESLTEESAIRRRLEAQGFGASAQLEELIQLELRLANAKKNTNDEAERGVQIEEQRRGQAGGIGTQMQTTEAASATSAGRGSAAGGGRGDGAPVVNNITINGLPTDRASVRSWVSDILLPELERVSRLSR